MQRLVGVFLTLSLIGAAPAISAETDWLNPIDLRSFATNQMAGKFYATAITCKQWPGSTNPKFVAMKMTYKSLGAKRPFHKWQFVFGKETELSAIIGKIRLKTEPQLKYRIINKSTYAAADGSKRACAIVYR